MQTWQVGRELYAADQLIQSAVNNLWGGAFSLISLTMTMLGFVVATFMTISNDDRLAWELVLAALLIKLTPWPAFLFHQTQLLRTTGGNLRTQEDVMGLMCVDEEKETTQHYLGAQITTRATSSRVTNTEEAREEMQSLFERLAHVHFLSFFQYYMTTVTASQFQDTLALAVQCIMILALIGHEAHSSSAANITYALTSLQTMRSLSCQKMTFLINLSAGYQVSSPH